MSLNQSTAREKKRPRRDAGSPAPRVQFDPLRFTKRIVTEVERQALVAEAAYYRAEHRGFAPGHEIDDWAAAEQEVSEPVILTPGPPGK